MKIRSLVKFFDMPKLENPILVEGLPGVGLVASLVVRHIIGKFKANRFCDIKSPFFKPVAVVDRSGRLKTPINSLYYIKTPSEARGDLIVLYGNSQATTFIGQNELSETILDLAFKFECIAIVTLGGLSTLTPSSPPKVYYTTNHPEYALMFEKIGLRRLSGRVYGMAGTLVGLAKFKGMQGVCLLGEVKSGEIGREAAREIIKVLSVFLNLHIDLSNLEESLDHVREDVFGLI